MLRPERPTCPERLPRGPMIRLGLIEERPLDAAGVDAIGVPCAAAGAIRLALAGRDPGGTIEPGSRRHLEIVELIGEAFLELEDPQTGTPVVHSVETTDDRFGVDRSADLPDVLVLFNHLAPDALEWRSARLGSVRVRPRTRHIGEHGPPGWIAATGRGIRPGSVGEASSIDLASTLLDLVDVPVPDWVEGRPIHAIAG